MTKNYWALITTSPTLILFDFHNYNIMNILKNKIYNLQLTDFVT